MDAAAVTLEPAADTYRSAEVKSDGGKACRFVAAETVAVESAVVAEAAVAVSLVVVSLVVVSLVSHASLRFFSSHVEFAAALVFPAAPSENLSETFSPSPSPFD